MKKLKKLTREQQKIISDQGLDPKEFLSERDTPEIFIFVNKVTGEKFEFTKQKEGKKK